MLNNKKKIILITSIAIFIICIWVGTTLIFQNKKSVSQNKNKTENKKKNIKSNKYSYNEKQVDYEKKREEALKKYSTPQYDIDNSNATSNINTNIINSTCENVPTEGSPVHYKGEINNITSLLKVVDSQIALLINDRLTQLYEDYDELLNEPNYYKENTWIMNERYGLKTEADFTSFISKLNHNIKKDDITYLEINSIKIDGSILNFNYIIKANELSQNFVFELDIKDESKIKTIVTVLPN